MADAQAVHNEEAAAIGNDDPYSENSVLDEEVATTEEDSGTLSRTINFGHSLPQVLVVDTMRYAWVRDAPTEDRAADYLQQLSRAQTAWKEKGLLDSPNHEINTPWKEEIYYMYNHLFHDITMFIATTNRSLGHFHAPNHSHFAIESQFSSKTFDKNILLIPTYLATGCGIIITTPNAGDAETLGYFTPNEPHTIMVVKAGVKLDIEVITIDDKYQEGDLRAVMVFGQLCIDEDGPSEEEIEAAALQAEVQSSQQMAMLAFASHQRSLAAQGGDEARASTE